MNGLAVITGASRGIGRATAEAFVEAGWSVLTLSRSDCTVPSVRHRTTDMLAPGWVEALESWLEEAERAPTRPDASVLLEIAAAARRVFDRVGRWIKAPDPESLDIALAASVQRVYAPSRPRGHMSVKAEETWIHCVEYPDKGLVLAATSVQPEINAVASRLCRTAKRLAERGPAVFALELLVPVTQAPDEDRVVSELRRTLAEAGLSARFTLDLRHDDGRNV